MYKKSTFVAILLGLLFNVSAAKAAAGDSIEWKQNYADALKEAQQTGKPLLLDFWATWCGPCKTMDATVWHNSAVVDYSYKFICVKVDIDVNGPLAGFFGANAVPTTVFADPWGNELNRRVGLMKPDEMLLILRGFPSNFKEVKEPMETLTKDGKNMAALSMVGDFYQKNGALDVSDRYYERALKTDEAKNDCKVKENIYIKMGLNRLKAQKHTDARKLFEKCLKETPNGAQCDTALLGLLTAQLNLGKRDEAEKTFQLLMSKYPNSPATQQAAHNLQQTKR